MLESTRREANELYVMFSLLATGMVEMGDEVGRAKFQVPVAMVVRREHDGLRRYVIEGTEIHCVGPEPNPGGTKIHCAGPETNPGGAKMHSSGPALNASDTEFHSAAPALDARFPREDFRIAAEWLRRMLTDKEKSSSELLDISDLEGFLSALQIVDLEAQTEDRTDLHVALWSVNAPLLGLRIQSRLCGFTPLLDGGRTANLKFEQTGIRFSSPAVHKINWTEQPGNVAEVARRILYIESLGGVLKYCDVADKIFKSNLLVLDTNLPRILATMLMLLHLDGIARIDELTAALEEKNPLKVKDELVRKHGLYRFKVRQLLLAAAWGMRPAKVFDGSAGAVGGYLMVDAAGGVLLYSRADEQTFADYLFTHTRLEKSLPDESKYGYLERENGAYYLKLNLKIGLIRR
ncbi:MAG: HpaII family restriction endonuclease [Bacteroidaceae bacterium]|nr:HpaII family restriction endonuclease [Bacteroidaceae bacterium]